MRKNKPSNSLFSLRTDYVERTAEDVRFAALLPNGSMNPNGTSNYRSVCHNQSCGSSVLPRTLEHKKRWGHKQHGGLRRQAAMRLRGIPRAVQFLLLATLVITVNTFSRSCWANDSQAHTLHIWMISRWDSEFRKYIGTYSAFHRDLDVQSTSIPYRYMRQKLLVHLSSGASVPDLVMVDTHLFASLATKTLSIITPRCHWCQKRGRNIAGLEPEVWTASLG